MLTAVGLARRALGSAWPNPAVGCVLVKDGRTVGRGWTQPGGRPHAETEALGRAGVAARGATAYVTLEPCAHRGRTPPCADALVEAGIARVVAAAEDPDPRVDGRGFARLGRAGVEVVTGVCAAEAEDVLAGFLTRVRHGRPLVTLKLATTLDGRIATRAGESRWITGPEARAAAHLLRARHDAVLVGARTALVDDPSLTCRLPGLESASPVRVVVDVSAPLPAGHALLARGNGPPTWVLAPEGRAAERAARYAGAAVEVVPVPGTDAAGVDLAAALAALGGRGITTVLVEGGGRIAATLLAAGLVDRLVWFRAPRLIGGDGRAAVDALGVESLDATIDFAMISSRKAGEDVVEVYRRAPARPRRG